VVGIGSLSVIENTVKIRRDRFWHVLPLAALVDDSLSTPKRPLTRKTYVFIIG
jgi:hypothetical protein